MNQLFESDQASELAAERATVHYAFAAGRLSGQSG